MLQSLQLDYLSSDNRTYIILKKLKENNVCFVKADKGESTIVMNREQYQTKIFDFLQENGATPIHYNIKTLSKNIRQLIDNSSLVITSQPLKDSLKKNVLLHS